MRRYSAWLLVLLVLAIGAGGVLVWARYSPGRPIEVAFPSQPQLEGQVYVDGAVNSPGWYPLKGNDSVEGVIRDAGGTTDQAANGQFKLHVPTAGETKQPQKVDLNQAEAWLLQALPGIGETRARAIVDYRRKNGPFRDTSELLKVEGIGTTTYEKIKDLITASD